MVILFAVIARGSTVLTKFSTNKANYSEIVERVLSRIDPENSRLTFTMGSYLVHYIYDNRITYLCITDDDYERSKAFSFLADIKRRFTTQYGELAHTALPYSMNNEFSAVLQGQIRYYSSDASDNNILTRVEHQVDDLKGIMVRNIDSITQRGERLELLIDKTEELSNSSVSFRKSAVEVSRKMWWKNIKMKIILVLVILVILYIIVSVSCGGPGWKNCV